MDRKIVAQKGSFTVSLPKPWAKKHNLQAGNSLFVSEQSNSLTYSIDEQKTSRKELSLEFEEFTASIIRTALSGAYKGGYSHIQLMFKEEYSFIALQDIVSEFVGFILDDSKPLTATVVNQINFQDISVQKNVDKLFSLLDYSFIVVQKLLYQNEGRVDELMKLIRSSLQQRDYLLRAIYVSESEGAKQTLYSFVESLEKLNSGLKRAVEEYKHTSHFAKQFPEESFIALHTQFKKLRNIFSTKNHGDLVKVTKSVRLLKNKFNFAPSYVLLSENLFTISSRLTPITFLEFKKIL